jgi:hypothetical protein
MSVSEGGPGALGKIGAATRRTIFPAGVKISMHARHGFELDELIVV